MNARLRPAAAVRPRLGFLGVGWIGRQRMQVLSDSGVAQVTAVADAHLETAAAAADSVPGACVMSGLDELLGSKIDGLVIATPSGAHAAQATRALESGIAVFCQKPLTRTAEEAVNVVEAARRADRLLEVDFSYRHVAGIDRLRELVQSGEMGTLQAVDLTFHNAYGPDKPWFKDMAQSGGGCVMDLGVHLIDLAQWIAGEADIGSLDARLSVGGIRLTRPVAEVEDYASVQWNLRCGASARMACSWNLPAGCDAVIEAAFYGTRGGVAIRNVGGSFHDFKVERFDGTRRELLASPPDPWGGRALVDWAQRLAAGERFDPASDRFVEVARVVDAIYGR
ncbi:MAG: Gfo/Idh/MocA family oxidoreductase [Pseudomonadota bacterium]|nr:Gfo/Idh/MocA family oxidoreductase [Pseudomonadota bacterium]